MRKQNKQAKLSRSVAHRRSLLRNLSQELIRHGQIKTTLAKAKAVRPFVEPLITKAINKEEKEAMRLVSKVIYDHEVVKELVMVIGPKFREEKRKGGYTRIIKLGARQGDAAEEAIVQLVKAE